MSEPFKNHVAVYYTEQHRDRVQSQSYTQPLTKTQLIINGFQVRSVFPKVTEVCIASLCRCTEEIPTISRGWKVESIKERDYYQRHEKYERIFVLVPKVIVVSYSGKSPCKDREGRISHSIATKRHVVSFTEKRQRLILKCMQNLKSRGSGKRGINSFLQLVSGNPNALIN